LSVMTIFLSLCQQQLFSRADWARLSNDFVKPIAEDRPAAASYRPPARPVSQSLLFILPFNLGDGCLFADQPLFARGKRAVLLGCLRILNLEFCQDVPRRTRCSQPSTTLADFLTQIFCRSRFACGRHRGLCPVQEPIRFLLVQRSYLSMMSKAQIFPATGSFECSTNRSSISAGLPVMFLPSVNGPGLRCQRATNRGTRPCVLATL
jgi:hypothetical protein